MAGLELTDIHFLQNQDAEILHKEMLDAMPDDLDKTEGGFAHDLTYPTALRTAKFAEQNLLNVLSCIFPQFSFGEFLDYHGDNGRSLTRKPATKSYGHVQVLAKPGTKIPVGTVFTTTADDNTEYVEFISVASGTAESDTEAINLAVEAMETGIKGNVPAHAVTMLGTNINGVISVDNAEPITGGADIEDDDSFRDRIVAYDRNRSVSFVGSISDYERWALEVPGVGGVKVIPAQDDSGTVTLIITDANGDPANESLKKAVYNHIQSPDDEKARLSNVNALLSVVAPETMTITITATVEVLETSTLDKVESAFITNLKQYLTSCDGEIKRSKVGEILSATVGLNDYSNLLINGAEKNIKVLTNQLPHIDKNSVTLTEGVVE
jgi:uncharacterized phage protein gp47/JayE